MLVEFTDNKSDVKAVLCPWTVQRVADIRHTHEYPATKIGSRSSLLW